MANRAITLIHLSNDEQNLLFDFIYLTIIEKMLQKDFVAFEQSNFKLNSIYLSLLDSKLRIVQNQLKEIKFHMTKQRVKVFINHQASDDSFVQYNYSWNNKAEGSQRFFRDGMKMEVTKRMKMLFG